MILISLELYYYIATLFLVLKGFLKITANSFLTSQKKYNNNSLFYRVSPQFNADYC